MKAELILAKANLMKKKASAILIFLIILLSALILSTAMGMMQMMSKPFENMFERQNGSHVYMYYDQTLNKGRDIVDFWKSQQDVKSVNVLNAYIISGYPYSKGQKLGTQLIITEMPDEGLAQDKIVQVEGNASAVPGENEVWIPTAFAYANQIKIGDYLELPTLSGAENYRVGAIVVDPLYSSSMMNPLRVWVRSGEIEQSFKKANPVRFIGLRYKNYSATLEAAAWKQFEDAMGGPFVGLKTPYETTAFAATFTYKILSVILLAFAGIIVIIGFVIIFYTLSSSILADYTTIGVMKAQGFSSYNLSAVYILQFFLLSLFAVPLGILISYPVQQMFLASLIRTLGITLLAKTNLLSGAVAFMIIIITVLAAAYISSLKASRIKPIHALRYGAPERKYAKQQIPLSCLRDLPVNFMLGIRDIFSEKKQSAFILIITLFTGLIFAFSISSSSSMNKAFGSMELFGVDNSELSVVNSHRVQGIQDQDILKILHEQPEIEKVTPMLFLLNSSFYVQDIKANKNVVGNAFDADMDSIGLKVMAGRNPVDQNEIALSYGLATKMHIKPG
ncbi:MAG TPA: ABC transporter permease, partial [Desulfobacteria bacterium]|nr:ABC transporter permease [Desulfobacteria bacterium]